MERKKETVCAGETPIDSAPGEILDFRIPVNPLGPSKKAGRKWAKIFPAAAAGVSDGKEGDLIKTLARFHGISAEELLLGAGATEFIFGLPRALSLRRALLASPNADVFERPWETPGPGPKPAIDYFEVREEDGFEVEANELIACLTRGYDALFLANPGYPTGILTSREDLERVLAQTEKQETWFVLDETGIDYREEHSLKEKAASSRRLLILRSFSNFFALPGLRVGYLIGNRQTIGDIRGHFPPRRVNAPGEIAAAESLSDEGFIRRTKEWIPGERERLVQGLRSIPGFVPYPASANFLLIQLLPFLGIDGERLEKKLLARGIRVDDCRWCRTLAPFFFSVALRSRKENNLLIKALRAIRGELS